ncbi:type VI secretion protein [Burkholderia ubonensis]|uniref:Type VI secretion protein n=1 Tax=Burkholderia ubonensis TaxID=101571 RepID=A0A102LPM3_9BURK|nr:type VI secretion system lipoprotein TssJ [Burkholderia ubonensis]KUZ74461.1 type VI secretion protein [Burkholderia ubonensis]KUZ90210.1 type VI secretion protein [Burkholderia ubonensis]KUZ97569.1 type VI secretion protein [Burkholderia ubonensis]
MDKHPKNPFRTPTGRSLVGAAAALAILATAGCGVGQAVKDSTVGAAKWVFTTQVKTMNVDLVARSSLNANAAGQPLSTVVRLYQLKDAKTFDQLDYTQLQTHDLDALKADLLATKDVVLRPGANASVSEPMHPDAHVVGVVAFFREPGEGAVWKLTMPKKQWKQTDPVKVEVRDNVLVLLDAKDQPVTRAAPRQSAPGVPAPKPKAVSATGHTG